MVLKEELQLHWYPKRKNTQAWKETIWSYSGTEHDDPAVTWCVVVMTRIHPASSIFENTDILFWFFIITILATWSNFILCHFYNREISLIETDRFPGSKICITFISCHSTLFFGIGIILHLLQQDFNIHHFEYFVILCFLLLKFCY